MHGHGWDLSVERPAGVPNDEALRLRIHDEASRVRDFQRSPAAASLDDLALAAYLQWSRVCVLHSSRGLVAAVRHDPVLAEFPHPGQVWLETDEEQCSQLKQPVPSSRPVVSPLAAGWHGPVLAESQRLRGTGPPAEEQLQQRLAFAQPVVSRLDAGWHGPVFAASQRLRGTGPPADEEQFFRLQPQLAFAQPVVSLVAAGHCEEECSARVVTSPRLCLMA